MGVEKMKNICNPDCGEGTEFSLLEMSATTVNENTVIGH